MHHKPEQASGHLGPRTSRDRVSFGVRDREQSFRGVVLEHNLPCRFEELLHEGEAVGAFGGGLVEQQGGKDQGKVPTPTTQSSHDDLGQNVR